MTKHFNWQKKINKEELEECIKALKENKTIVFPTETVYGIGANVFSEDAINKIYEAKSRAKDNPLIVHVANKKMIEKITKNINQIEKKLIDNFMPGPFTLILEKKEIIPNIVSAGLNTIGIRMPKNNIAIKIIEEANIPIAAPSANISGKPSGTSIEDIKEELNEKVEIFIDGGMSEIGLESTVVKVENDIPIILRPGKITKEEIIKVIGRCELSQNLFKEVKKEDKVESPGMKYRHYAPETKCVLVYSQNEEDQILKIKELINKYDKVCILGFEEHKGYFKKIDFINLGNKNDLEEISRNIFKSLRKADKLKVDIIIIEGVEKEGLGLAIMNRLIRTCEYNIF